MWQTISCSGQPRTTSNPEWMEKVHNSLETNCSVTFKMMAKELNVNKELVKSTIATDVHKIKICLLTQH
jgi:hypothetical protein